MGHIREGDLVLFVSVEKSPRTTLRRMVAGEIFHTHRGSIRMDDVIGMGYGTAIRTHLGQPFYLIPPTTDDFITRIAREGQIIFPKDSGYIMMKLGITPGSRVLETGTGSGGLCLALAAMVGDEGHVYSYDTRKDMQGVARSNLRKAGLDHRVTFTIRDAHDGFDEAGLDAAFLDVREPWEYLDQARATLKGGGALGALVPTINQLVTLVAALSKHPYYAYTEVEELILRPYRVVPDRIRPDDQMIGHTGFLLFCRAVFPMEETGEEAPPEEPGEGNDEEEQA